jgi:glucosamine 6-phosphate synthetase-like amidotransferase/phosphosugar isomerase protein
MGVICGTKNRSRNEHGLLTDIFTRLLLLSEHRGPYATGAAWVKTDGTYRIEKVPVPARTFVQTPQYAEWINGIDQQVTVLMGHTRWPTRGSHLNLDNDHPLHCAPILLTHNGTILDVAQHFRHLHLPRTAQVDSELLARIAQHAAGDNGLNLDEFLSDLTSLDGRMSVALVASTRPDEVILLKGNMPLAVRIHRRKRILLYASESRILDAALGNDAGWEEIPVAPGEALAINTAAIHAPRRWRFAFRGMARSSTWQCFTGE